MSDKRYPTRMHEVLGVATEERFTYSEYGDRKFWLSESGLLYRICDDGTSIPTTQGTLVLFINNPERIRRITGYLTPSKNWNNGKRAELADRVAHGMANQCCICGAEMAEGDHVCKLDRRGAND